MADLFVPSNWTKKRNILSERSDPFFFYIKPKEVISQLICIRNSMLAYWVLESGAFWTLRARIYSDRFIGDMLMHVTKPFSADLITQISKLSGKKPIWRVMCNYLNSSHPHWVFYSVAEWLGGNVHLFIIIILLILHRMLGTYLFFLLTCVVYNMPPDFLLGVWKFWSPIEPFKQIGNCFTAVWLCFTMQASLGVRT